MKQSLYKYGLILSIAVIFSSITALGQTQKVTTLSACRLYADIGNTSAVLGYVPIGKEVEVLDILDEYLLVKYDDQEGFIVKDKTDAKTKLIIAEQPEEVESNYQPASRYDILIQKYGARTGKAIYEHKIWKGADHNMVKDSWGKPINVSRDMKESGTTEVWSYRKSILTFRDGILVEWEPNR